MKIERGSHSRRIAYHVSSHYQTTMFSNRVSSCFYRLGTARFTDFYQDTSASLNLFSLPDSIELHESKWIVFPDEDQNSGSIAEIGLGWRL